VDAADAREHDLAAELLAPLLGRARPRSHAHQVAELVARVDDRAVDLAGPLRAQAARVHRQHRLVELREPRGRPAAAQVRQPREHQVQRRERRVPGAAGDPADVRGRAVRGGQVPAAEGQRALEVGDVAVGGALGQVGEQAAGTVEPAGHHDDVAAGEPQQRQVEGGGGSAGAVTVLFEDPERALGEPQRLLRPSEPPRGPAQEHEVGRPEPVGHGQRVVGGLPVTARVGRASRREHVRNVHGGDPR